MELHSIELEKSILAALMKIEDSYIEIVNLVSANDFYAERHKIIFETIARLSEQNEPYDVLMVQDALAANNRLDDIGGDEYLGDVLIRSDSTLFSLKGYAKRVREMSAIRQAKQSLLDGQAILETEGEYSAKVNTIIESLTNIVDKKSTQKGAETISQMMTGFFNRLQDYALSGATPFIKTNFITVDNRVNLQNGELLIIAGRPSMGKSALAQNVLQNIVENIWGTGVFFSLEMPKEQVMQRFMASTASVHLSKVMSGQGLSENDYSNLTSAAEKFGVNFNLFIDDRNALTIGQMRSTLNKIRQKQGKISVIMVDYIQIMGGITGTSSSERSASIGDISRALKGFAKEYDCLVIALSQLNRESEKRPDKKPKLSDLRESGAIESDADHIWVINRPEVYEQKPENKGKAEIHVLKQRQGAIGMLDMSFEGHYSRFVDQLPNFDEPNLGGDE